MSGAKRGTRRFENIKIGDQLMKTTESRGWRGGKDDFKGPPVPLSKTTWYYIVTDLWFDPVKGDRSRQCGEMVAIRRLTPNGEPAHRKEGHTIRGLASNRFRYADRDYIEFCQSRLAAMDTGSVIGIGTAHTIRRRPKIAGRPL